MISLETLATDRQAHEAFDGLTPEREADHIDVAIPREQETGMLGRRQCWVVCCSGGLLFWTI